MFGKEKDNLVKMARMQGKLPPALQNRPDVAGLLIPYFKAFFVLSTLRGHSMGAELRLTSSEILAYAQIHGFMDDIEFFFTAVTECDSVYFEHLSQNSKSTGKPGKLPKKIA